MYYNRKICIFPKGLTDDSGKKFYILFEPMFSVKETLVLSFDDIVFSKGSFLDNRNVILPLIVEKFAFFHLICIFTHDSG